MSFFNKKSPVEDGQADVSGQDTMQGEPAAPITTEERLREWWQTHFNESLPEEIHHWLKQLTRTEARRLNTASQILSPQQLSRIEDSRRLAETKLQNIEQMLMRVRKNQEWIRNFEKKKAELKEHHDHLYEVNKKLAARVDDMQALERFEMFETVLEQYQRMTLLQTQSRQNKEMLSQLAREADDAAKESTQKERQLKLASDKREQSFQQMLSMRTQHEQANRILGAQDVLDLDQHATGRLLDTAEQQALILEKECEELQAECIKQQDIITKQRAERQTIEPHANLLEHGEMVLTLLDRLNELRQEMGTIQQQADTIAQRGREENEMLSRVFAEYQKIDADIKTLNSELVQHRDQNAGQSSNALQNRAMELKSRRQMLLSAQSLCHRIQLGYQLIEEKTRALTTLRLNVESMKQSIAQLEAQVEPMRKLCHEKEYTLTMSKSQNVIQLRSDLREGVNCTVCGATHHPYHSDTMLEQGQLISQMNTDYELLQAELKAKEKQLFELQLQLASQTAQQEMEEETLSALRSRQDEDVNEWSVYADLDRSFQECTPYTNLDARTAHLRQLIENAARDADEALHELDQYNFHQSRINELSERLTQKEQALSDLTVRLNEVNTGCQVLSRQTEQIRQVQSIMQGQYTQRYEQLRKLITLRDWYNSWQGNHESIQLRISSMMEKWQSINSEIDVAEKKLSVAKTALKEKQATNDFLRMFIQQIKDEESGRISLRNEGDKQLGIMLNGHSVKEHFDQSHQQYAEANKEELKHREQMEEILKRLAAINGKEQQLREATEAIDKEAAQCQSKLDIWMRQFNANHPPVQYNELQQTFCTDRDWNAVRTSLRELQIESTLEQANVDNLRKEIVALQSAGVLSTIDEDTTQVMKSLIEQQKQLEDQHKEVLMQLAQYEIALQNNETCKAQLKVEEDAAKGLME